MVRRAERASRVDFDGPARKNSPAVVAAVHDEAPRPDGRQQALRFRHPVKRRDSDSGCGLDGKAGVTQRGCTHTERSAVVVALDEPAAAVLADGERELLQLWESAQDRGS